MIMNYRQVALFGLFVLTAASPILAGQQTLDKEYWRDQEVLHRKKQEACRKLHESLPRLDVRGRVVDQNGAPVPGAKVTVEWKNADELLDKFSEMKTDVAKTDEQGYFKLSCNKPLRASARAEKEGYASLSGEVSGLVQMRNLMPEAVPAVITLRKKGDLTFLLVREGSAAAWAWIYTNKTAKVSMDLLAKVGNRPSKEKIREDLSAAIHYNATNNTWSIVYTVTPGDGLVCSDRCFYEAPNGGYTNMVSLTVSNDQISAKCFLYLRSRSPVLYSRVEVEHRANTAYPEEGYQCRIYIENVCVNPYGERNLEYDERFERSWRARDELTQEALTAFGQGCYPEKCGDVPARIKAADKRKKVPTLLSKIAI